ncbi:MAG: hypothetical protein Q7I96_06855 [Methanobacteriaceae archaeon]|nr:hypothetical protein [Methanobacteriaceae archaeon]
MKDKLKQLQDKLNFKKSNKSNLLNKNTHNNQKLTCPSSSCPLISRWGIVAIIAIFTIFLASFFVPYNNIHPTTNATNTTSIIVATKEILGNDSMGVVTKEGPYGNPNSTVKIAYILGQHPRESRSHNATMANIRENSNSLKNCYYLYYINVTKGTYDYSQGRLNGQKLSYKYIVPDVNKNNYSLVIDVHASNGRYIDKSFTFVPFSDSKSLKIAKNLTTSLKWLYYYSMPEPSSPAYSTIPIIKNGTPAIIYEAYANPSNTIKQQVKDFIMAVDQLKL